MEPSVYIDTEALRRFAGGESSGAYEVLGCHFLPEYGAHRFAVWAPNAQSVAVVGDFNGWDAAAAPMEKLDCGVWCALVRGCVEGQIYKYAVTSRAGRTVLKADPFAFHCETGPATGSRVWDIGGWEWGDGAFRRKFAARDHYASPLSIYEVHIGSWKKAEGEVYPSYRAAADSLADYCADMGYNCVELLPLAEYPYEGSWGYQVTGYFAPTSRYGTPQDFMYFVDTLHRAGVAVLMDWVPAHFPRDEHGLAQFDGTPVYERSDPQMAAHPDWGTLIFDYEKPAVQSFLLSSAEMFVKNYHIDGLRVDAVSSMLYLGYGRGKNFKRNRLGGDTDLGAVALLRRVNALVRALGGVTVAEESSAYPRVTAPETDGGLGFTFKWDMGFMHDTLDYFSLDPLFRRGSHNKLTFSMMYAFSERFILAFSHDEVVHGKKSMLDKMSGEYDEKFANLRALYGYQYAHPGKKLGFMGGEFGQFIEWDYEKQLDWFLLSYPRHGEMQRFVRELNRFYLAHPAMYARDSGWDGFTWLNVDDRDRSSIAFLRTDGKQNVVCVFNFTPNVWKDFRIGLPAPGRLRLLLSSDEFRFGGTGMKVKKALAAKAAPFPGFPCSAALDLPPLSAQYFSFREVSE